MQDLLKEFFLLSEEKQHLNYFELPGYSDARRKLILLMEQVDKTLGREFYQELVDSLMLVGDLKNMAWFRHGYQFSGRMLLEMVSIRP